MIRIIVSEEITSPKIERGQVSEVKIWVSPGMSYLSIEGFLHEYLTFPEIQIFRKLWMQDDYIRNFEVVNGNLEITDP
jgi:hypothetical protein